MKRGSGFAILAGLAAVTVLVASLYGWSVIKERRNTITLTAQFESSAGQLHPGDRSDRDAGDRDGVPRQ